MVHLTDVMLETADDGYDRCQEVLRKLRLTDEFQMPIFITLETFTWNIVTIIVLSGTCGLHRSTPLFRDFNNFTNPVQFKC